MNLSSRQLKAFVALVEERNFTRAAKRCHLSQPAFSALIQSLEQEAGVRLFDRSTRHVDLTAEGHELETSARGLLTDMSLALENLRDHAAKRRGRVSVAALPSLAAGWLPELLARFHERYPGVTLQVHDAVLDPCLDLVARGEADFAVAALRPDMSDLEGQFLHADPFFLVCRQDHPLASRDRIRLRDALKWPWIATARNSSVRKHLEQALGDETPSALLEVAHLATVTGLVKAGMGIALVPAMTLFQFERPGLVIKPLSGRVPARRLYLIRRRRRSLSVAGQALYDLLLANAPSNPSGVE
ncbi:LysR family transcriptional regulator [Alloalcanivorax sp. C16-2]|uniref:LysR family transcriptional regulator n=1 Tax=Alloalcanivorax TaxID=3020832 RepID=UPI00193442BB|nr:LysR family transcriptional regulator [Alloalcanivorax marinus]MBL7249904.1 LysR family transcriptional regulator [Alloalcanivorax marinus]